MNYMRYEYNYSKQKENRKLENAISEVTIMFSYDKFLYAVKSRSTININQRSGPGKQVASAR